MDNNLTIKTSNLSSLIRMRTKSPSQKLRETLIFSRRIKNKVQFDGTLDLQYTCEVPPVSLDKETEKKPVTGNPLPQYSE